MLQCVTPSFGIGGNFALLQCVTPYFGNLGTFALLQCVTPYFGVGGTFALLHCVTPSFGTDCIILCYTALCYTRHKDAKRQRNSVLHHLLE